MTIKKRAKPHHFTPEQIGFLRKHYPQYSSTALTKVFNKQYQTSLNVNQIRKLITKQKLSKNGQNMRSLSDSYTDEQLSFIKHAYLDNSLSATTKLYNQQYHENRSADQIKYVISKLKYYKRRAKLPTIDNRRRTARGYPAEWKQLLKLMDTPDDEWTTAHDAQLRYLQKIFGFGKMKGEDYEI